MKTTLCIVTAMMLLTPPKAHALFGHVAEERQRRIATEEQLSQEQQRLDEQQHLNVEQQQLTNRWQIVATILAAGVTIALVIGTAIGSKTRRGHEANH